MAPSTTQDAVEESLPSDLPPRSDKPLVRKTPNPRPRGFEGTVNMDTWEVPASEMMDLLSGPEPPPKSAPNPFDVKPLFGGTK
ncbi:hypothetical protein KC906_01700 [Candidatus Kaiserbacteria bacterium]|nr:hypothetical protein [Candidatus Kaiserbacteria bacterium]